MFCVQKETKKIRICGKNPSEQSDSQEIPSEPLALPLCFHLWSLCHLRPLFSFVCNLLRSLHNLQLIHEGHHWHLRHKPKSAFYARCLLYLPSERRFIFGVPVLAPLVSMHPHYFDSTQNIHVRNQMGDDSITQSSFSFWYGSIWSGLETVLIKAQGK